MKAKDVKSVHSENPELKEVGTATQYYKYLKTIFPESKVKDIVYHGSPNKFPEFKDPSTSGLSHIWFSEKPLKGQFGENVYSVILNIKNPLNEFDNENYPKELKNYEAPINPEWRNNYHLTGELPQYKYDGTIRNSRVDDGRSITVRSPDQIHILGSKKDIEGFKKHVNKNKKEDSLESKVVSSTFITIFIFSLFLISLNITGNVIGNMARAGSNLLGIILFLSSISGFFVYRKLKH
jgi:hypothetical protein